jgi:hypothetical protein
MGSMKKAFVCILAGLFLLSIPAFAGAEVKIGFQAPLTG